MPRGCSPVDPTRPALPARPRSRPPTRSSPGSAGPTAGSVGRGRTAGRRGEGVLEDYADLADGLLALYEATFDERWFVAARELADTILDHFADPAGGFFDTADDHETLVTRPKDPQDNATPSGGSMATLVLLRLAALDRRASLSRRRRARARDRDARSSPAIRPAFANWLRRPRSRSAGSSSSRSSAIRPTRPTRALLAVAREGEPAGPRRRASARTRPRRSIPLLADRTMIDGRPTAYVCRDFACRLPVTDPGRARGAARRARRSRS